MSDPGYSYCADTSASYVADPVHFSSLVVKVLTDSRRNDQNNLFNTVMLIHYVKVFQQSWSAAIGSQAATSTNQTRAGGTIALTSAYDSMAGDARWVVPLVVTAMAIVLLG